MNKDLQVGQRVRLSEDYRWVKGDDNPTDCEGTVKVVRYGWIAVNWDNGCSNVYLPADSDLIPVNATANSALETLV